MKRIMYVGGKPNKHDNIAGTNLTWRHGETIEVQDNKQAEKLLQHQGIWVDADSYDPAQAELNKAVQAIRDDVPTVVVAVSKEDLAKLLAGRATLRVIDLTEPAVKAAAPATEPDWSKMNRHEIGKKLNEVGMQVDGRKMSDEDMRIFAKQVWSEAQKQAA